MEAESTPMVRTARMLVTVFVVLGCVGALASAVVVVLRQFDGRPVLVTILGAAIAVAGWMLVRLILVAIDGWLPADEDGGSDTGKRH